LKILYITYYWPPAGGPGVQRAIKFAKFLPEFGVTPLILTVDEKIGSYPLKDQSLLKDISPDLKITKTSTFEPLSLYSKLLKKEVPYSGFANESNPSFTQKISRFIRGNLFIPDARRGWNSYAIREAKRLIKEEGIQAILTSSPPHSTQLIGLRLKEIFGIPWIADLRDPWTDIYYYSLMLHTPFAKYLDKKYEREVLEKADALLVTNNDTKNLFASKSDSIQKDKIHVIYNGFDDGDFAQHSKVNSGQFVITYTGTIASNYHIEAFVEAFGRLCKSVNEKEIKLKFVGKVSEEIKEKFKEVVDKVEFIGYVPHSESIQHLINSSALLLAIPQVANSEAILPGKLFEYLAARKPMICLGPKNGDVATIISDCKAGKTFGDNEGKELTQYLTEQIEIWRSSDRKIELSGNEYLKYSRKAQTEKLAGVIKGLNSKY
jgi:glycosyltransferase involved in cell wall biosynthesis